MANNRIALKCNVCGDYLELAKSYGGEYCPSNNMKVLEEFLLEHAFCDKGEGETGDEGDFCLAYEFPKDGQETY